MIRTLLVLTLATAAVGQNVRVGRLLVATAAARDPDFARTVILVVHSDDRGVAGVMLNRPTDASPERLIPGLKDGGRGLTLYAGGPIAMGLNAVVRSRTRPAGARPIVGELWLVPEQADIRDALGRWRERVRVYIGLCGWTQKQLRGEIDRGLWRMSPADADIVFDSRVETLWQRLAARTAR